MTRIAVDSDGDLWEKIGPGEFRTLVIAAEGIREIHGIDPAWGPFDLYESDQ